MSDTIPIDSTVLVEWEEPTDEADGSFLGADAVGTVDLYDSDEVIVSGCQDLSATYVAGPPRRYQATIPAKSLTAGATYYAEFTLTNAGGTLTGKRRITLVAAYDS